MGWHWKQTRWNEYYLTGPAAEVERFSNFTDLCIYCIKHKIDATQA